MSIALSTYMNIPTMSDQDDLTVQSLLSYEVNGTHFLVQSLGNAHDTIVQLDESTEDQNAVSFVNHIVEDNKDTESIPLVCFDGQVYIVQNGELQPLGITEFDYQQAVNSQQQPSGIVKESDEDKESNFMEITQYVSNSENISVQDVPSKIFESETYENEQLYVVARDNINPDDFVEVVTAFKCKVCPYTTQDREQLLCHVQNVHANAVPKIDRECTEISEDVKLVYMCGECSNCFSSMGDCREHMIQNHQLTNRGADTAEKKYADSGRTTSKRNQPNFKPSILAPRVPRSVVDLKSKLRTSDNSRQKKTADIKDRIVKCTYRGCFHKFSTEEKMQQHALCHLDAPYHANEFKCNICRDLKFPKWKACSLHLWKKHQIDVDLFSCKICKTYKSSTMVKLLTHMRVHSDNREFECPDCGKCFKQSSQLRNHRVMHLDRKTSETPRWYTSKTCDICSKTYADSKCLKNHIQAVHSKLRPYVCNVCGHSSARKAMLQMHLRQHTGDKPFNCELCDYKTGDHNSMRRHTMRHTGVRPYKCPHCPYSAIQSNSYKNHLRAKHPLLEGVFICDLCSFKTVKKESYVQHVGDHQKGLIKTASQKNDGENVEVFQGNIAAAQLIYSCLGAYSKVGKTIEASLMSSSTSADGTSQTITIQIPSKHLEGSLPIIESTSNSKTVEQEDEESMHCFLKIPREEEENIDTGGITIPAEPEEENSTQIIVDA